MVVMLHQILIIAAAKNKENTMRYTIKTAVLLLAFLPVMGVQAEVAQDCLVEGTVEQRTGEKHSVDVYVAFHSVKKSDAQSKCSLARKKRVAFKEPKNAMIENAPVGSTVTYRYIEQDNKDTQWRLISVGL